MDSLLLARWQFGITSAYHFVFVPLVIGTALLTAVLQTMWLRSGEERHLLATRFWGELFLIGFALGSATGIVQEFQLGLSWSGHFRFVGDGFGAQSATAGLLAFFLESTVLGLWIFGWNRLPRGVHTACIWLAASVVTLSAYFVTATDGPLRRPASRPADPGRGLARLTGAWAELGDPVRLAAFAHVLAAALLIAGALLVAGSAWHLSRDQYHATMAASLRVGLWSALLGGAGTAIAGVFDAGSTENQRPDKAAIAGALRHAGSRAAHASFAVMIGFGLLAVLTALFGLWHTRTAAGDGGRARFHLVATRVVPLLPLGAGIGWILTETGRRPRAVHGVLDAARAADLPGIGADRTWTFLTVLTLLYALLAVVEVGLLLRTARRGPIAAPAWDGEAGAPEPELGFAY